MGPRLRTVLIALALAALPIVGVAAAAAQTAAPDPGAAPSAIADPADYGAAGTTTVPDLPAAPDPTGKQSKRGFEPAGPQESQTSIRLHGLRNGRLPVGKHIKLSGTLRPFVKGEQVNVLLFRGSKVIKRKTLTVKRRDKAGSQLGQFAFSDRLVQPGHYRLQAIHKRSEALAGSKDRTRKFKMKYPKVHSGDRNSDVALFNRLLDNLGYVNDKGKRYDSATGRAVLAYRKVNDMKRNEKATSGMFKRLADGRGGYRLHHPGAGKHVEADLSRQVMVLAKHGEADEIYHISSGAPATPTITGHFQFYRFEPGTNSHGMVNSVYFQGGYATHGYASVPDYPASHGCLRNPIPDSKHIYNWIDLGDDIWVYH
jgi:hypothetical protein